MPRNGSNGRFRRHLPRSSVAGMAPSALARSRPAPVDVLLRNAIYGRRLMHMRSGKISVLAVSAALMAGEPDVGFGSSRASGAAPDSSVLVLAEPSEPGTRLVVAGKLLRPDGRPAGSQRVGVYHTDAKGEYGIHPTRRSYPPARDARLSGWLVTNPQGRFEVRTIRPGHYPGGGTPEHIHFIVGGVNNQE